MKCVTKSLVSISLRGIKWLHHVGHFYHLFGASLYISFINNFDWKRLGSKDINIRVLSLVTIKRSNKLQMRVIL